MSRGGNGGGYNNGQQRDGGRNYGDNNFRRNDNYNGGPRGGRSFNNGEGF